MRYPIPTTRKPRYRKPTKRAGLFTSLAGALSRDKKPKAPPINLASKMFPIKHSSHN